MRVAVGKWLGGAGERAVEGHIEIDRQRYLHVKVHLNHWQEGERPEPVMVVPEAEAQADEAGSNEYSAGDQVAELATRPVAAEPAPLELITWIRETRRMRSEEIHFIDSPTVGVLVFFRKIEG